MAKSLLNRESIGAIANYFERLRKERALKSNVATLMFMEKVVEELRLIEKKPDGTLHKEKFEDILRSAFEQTFPASSENSRDEYIKPFLTPFERAASNQLHQMIFERGVHQLRGSD